MKRLTFLLMLLASPSWGAIYYVDDGGSDASLGTSTLTPWRTFAKATSSSTCGDTVVVMDGTYFTSLTITKSCSPSLPYTVMAQNERQAFIDGSAGTFVPIMIQNSSYVTVDGLRAMSGDLAPASGGTNNGIINAYTSDHITLRHNLAHNTNRYRNAGHGYQLVGTTNSLLEENELYNFHRHGYFIGSNSNDNVIRRNYCNGRNYDDLPSGTVGVENPTDGPSEVGPDDCFIVYPGNRNIFENNIAEGDMLKHYAIEAISGGADSNQFLGNMGFGGAWNGVALDARGSTSATMPKNTLLKDMYIEGTNAHGVSGQTASTYRFNGNFNTVCQNCTAINSVDSFLVSRITAQPGDGNYSVTFQNSLSLNAQRAQTSGSFSTTTGYGFFIDPIIGTWAASNNNAFNSFKQNYSPTTSVNYSPNPNSAVDPQMGTCKVWQPDGSAAKSNNWGANILYRYQDGTLTSTPLWDPTTGEFPHGAIVTGINDIDGSSPYNVHTRLNVNTGGCAFPASYSTGGTPADPPAYVSTSGTGSISQSRTIAAAQNGMLAFFLLRDGGFNVGSLTSVTNSCGSQSFSLVKSGTSSVSSPLHRVEVWFLASPTSGSCTITATSTGSVTSWILTTVEVTSTAGVGDSATNGGNSATPSVTVSTNTNETIYSATSGSSAYSLSAGADQTLQTDTLLSPARLAVSTQAGVNGGVMDYVESGVSVWATVAVSMLPTSPGSPSSAVRTLSKYRVYSAYGTESGAQAIAGESQSASIAPTGEFRIRAEITGSGATTTPFGVALYCQKNVGGYSRVTNTLGAHGLRMVGGGVILDMPASLTPTTRRFSSSGSFHAGAMIRDQATAFTVPALPVGDTTEVVFTTAAVTTIGNTITCQVRQDDGSQLEAYTVTPTLLTVQPSASFGF
ncbi:MAG: hypothetical protein OJF50_002444 [Nitrospira sp.]|jgi:hypothetical protein|nr:hypothetical protein [Nitrospira sp.]